MKTTQEQHDMSSDKELKGLNRLPKSIKPALILAVISEQLLGCDSTYRTGLLVGTMSSGSEDAIGDMSVL